MTTSTAAWLAVGIMILLAMLNHEAARGLCLGAGLVGLIAWLAGRRTRPAADTREDVAPVVDDEPRRLLDSVFETLDDPIMVISGGMADDMSGRRIILANASARERLRVARDGGALVASVRDPEMLEAIDEALFGGLTRSVDYTVSGAQSREWKASIHPLPSPGPSPLVLLSLRDETDLRRTERMRVDFLANASHELRTPLASLTGFIETLKGHARDDTRARDRFLDIMAVQADRMGRLISDLMSLSRIELNEHVPPQGRADLSRTILDVVDAVGLLARGKGVTLKVEQDGAAWVEGERDEILQVVQNLVDNGIKYAPAGSSVEITVRTGRSLDDICGPRTEVATRLALLTPDREAGATYAAVTVRDHGPGMKREHLPRLTERFYRVEGQKSGAHSGTGLGLAIVKHITNRHRGGLVVESEEGQGAAFTAYFPVINQLDEAATNSFQEAAPL
ncbi:sensor histidine kinase [Brevundimonas sp.]|uniref:sensor histidine kinase n=1 Tax=Brevundimonas sp. TaxID=1871086 RepID=UPI003BAACD01